MGRHTDIFMQIFLNLWDIFSDLKPDNIVLTENGEVRLIDFGNTSYLDSKESKEMLSKQIAQFSSPEVFKRLPAGLASDWWCYGVIIAYLYQLKLPFEGTDKDEIQALAQSGKPDIEDIWPKQAKMLVSKLLVVNPDDRLSNVSSHKLFKSLKGPQEKKPYKPGIEKIPKMEKRSKNAEYFAKDSSVYEILEGKVIRIPSSNFLDTDHFKSL